MTLSKSVSFCVHVRWYTMRMRIVLLAIVTILILLPYDADVIAQTSASDPFTITLSVGSSGHQVTLLQKLLNQDADTRIASSGPGSPGNETAYFGSLTRLAVIRFQEKYADKILVPAGLTSGNGRVGLYTRAKLNSLSLSVVKAPATIPTSFLPPIVTSTEPSIPAKSPSVPTPVSQNPNLKNLDRFLTSVDTVASKQGLSSTAIAAIKEQVVKDVATTTDLRAAFLKQARGSSQSMESPYVGSSIATAIQRAFTKVFMPEYARAATGIPFGGALLFPFYCTQSQTWLLTIEPLPPSFAALLTYVPFTQAFLSYNIPATSWLLGEYEPGAGVCVAGACPYCVVIPNEGMISPMVGSSPL